MSNVRHNFLEIIENKHLYLIFVFMVQKNFCDGETAVDCSWAMF